MPVQRPTGKAFLEASPLVVYGLWVLVVLFPLVLAAVISTIDKRRSTDSLELVALALGVIAVSYTLRFYLIRHSKTLRERLRQASSSEKALEIIVGGFWWWLVTLICSILAVLWGHSLS